MNKNKVYIIGAEGTARNIIEQINDAREKHDMDIGLSGILIDSIEKGKMISGIPVIGGLKEIPSLLSIKESRFIFALYKPEKMKERHEFLLSFEIPIERFVNFIHPLAFVSASVRIGTGNVILSNTTVQSEGAIGNYNIINSNVTIEHEIIIGDANFIAAGSIIGSKVKIENHCFIGLNSSVRENTVLGDNVFVGMHSLVLRDLSNCKVVGVPAIEFVKK
jgi:sugar O-acyltransferase (sialic acid O-acetyltransferase NeuD family)